MIYKKAKNLKMIPREYEVKDFKVGKEDIKFSIKVLDKHGMYKENGENWLAIRAYNRGFGKSEDKELWFNTKINPDMNSTTIFYNAKVEKIVKMPCPMPDGNYCDLQANYIVTVSTPELTFDIDGFYIEFDYILAKKPLPELPFKVGDIVCGEADFSAVVARFIPDDCDSDSEIEFI